MDRIQRKKPEPAGAPATSAGARAPRPDPALGEDRLAPGPGRGAGAAGEAVGAWEADDSLKSALGLDGAEAGAEGAGEGGADAAGAAAPAAGAAPGAEGAAPATAAGAAPAAGAAAGGAAPEGAGGDGGAADEGGDAGEAAVDGDPVQASGGDGGISASSIRAAASDGVAGTGGALPHLDQIQASFGHHDVSGVQAHSDGAAAAGTAAMGAEAYAMGNQVAFGGTPTLHTAAHEAAHVVQQRAGIQLKGGVGTPGDPFERHADAVADRVVAGESAASLLDQMAPSSGGGASGGGAVQQRGPGATAITLDELREAVDQQVQANALVGYQSLSRADRTRLAADRALLTRLVALLEPTDGLTVLRELTLRRGVVLQVAGAARGDDTAFLTRVLQQLRLTTLTNLSAATADLGAAPPFLVAAVLDPIVNGPGVTAAQQVAFAATTNGRTILDTVWPGQSPIETLHALGFDPAQVLRGFTRHRSLAAWLLETELVLLNLITTTTDGPAWARAMWRGPHQAVIMRWMDSDPTYWGQSLGEALLHPAGGDAVALRASRPLATSVFRAIGTIFGGAGLAMCLGALRFTLIEKVKAVNDAGLLTAEILPTILGGVGVNATQQSALTANDEAIGFVQAATGSAFPHTVLALLAAAPATFCAAVARNNVFTRWVIDDPSRLVQTMVAVVDYNKWVDCFKTLANPGLLLTVAADPAVQAGVRAAIIARRVWHWLVTTVPQPIADELQATTLLALYGEGTGIPLADKYATWAALWTTPLKRAGDTHDYTGTTGAGVPWEERYTGLNPNDDAMNLFFHQYRQLPRTHVNTAAAIMMTHHYRLKATIAGVAKFFNKDTQAELPAPGHVPIDTSYYMTDNWIMMRSTSARTGTPSPARIQTNFGSPEAVNTPGVDPTSGGVSANMTVFANHATHEVGHAVGNRTLTRGTFATTGDNWAKDYGNWTDTGTGEGYARTLSFTAAMDTTNYTLVDTVDPTITQTVTGAVIRGFLAGVAQGGVTSQAGHALAGATAFTDPDFALDAIKAHAVLGANLMVMTVADHRGQFPAEGYHFPHGIDAGIATVHFYCTRWPNVWATYDAPCFRNKVSNYAMSSFKEFFAELYTARFTRGALPGPNHAQDPAAFFTALAEAGPAELGLPVPAPAVPGAGAAEGGPGTGGAAGAPADRGPATVADFLREMPQTRTRPAD